MPDTGLTPFILAMMRAPAETLAGANVEKLAAKYQIPIATAAWYLDQWRRKA